MKKKTVWTLLCVSLLSIPGSQIAQVRVPFKDLDRAIMSAMEAWKVPGLAMAIVKDGKVIYAKGFGYRDIEKKAPVDESTIFGCGSTTKAFTAALIGTLVYEGKIKWDDRVIDHLPDFRMYDPWVTREITIRDLLCHRSGLPQADFLWLSSSFSRDEIVRRIRFLRPESSFRSQFNYHNLMILTAGQLAARVTGKNWDESIKEKIFTPLGMTRSSTSIRDLEAKDDVATPYVPSNGAVTAIPWLNIDNIGPAGSINSTALDYAKWVQVHLGKGTFMGKKLWSEEVQDMMDTPHMTVSATATGLTHFNQYGLGWFLSDYRGKLVVWHSGATDGMGALVGMLPEENLGIALLSNTWYVGLLTNIMNRVFDMDLGVPEREWKKLEPPLPAAPPKEPQLRLPEDTKPAFPLSWYEGVYSSSIYGDVRVVLKEDKLALDFDSYPPATLEHRFLDTFRAFFGPKIAYMAKLSVEKGLNVTFTIDASAKITGMNIDLFGSFERGAEK